MKIDLHCHTLKCKKGDSDKRNVSKDKFLQKVNLASVEAVAITNHNTFNIKQYNSFLNDDFLVFPGIELDVTGINGDYGHCILIVSPKEADDFSKAIKEVVGSTNVNDFKITIESLAELASKFKSIVSCHYGKKPFLNDDSIEKLQKLLGEIPLFLEPSQLTSAGIFMAHNRESILGSDVQNWDDYESYSFPELKLNIDSYEHLILLIKKDKEIIKTFIDKKKKDSFEITPFEDQKVKLQMQLYNDTNIIIGGKGTGKTKILEAIDQHYKKEQNNSISSYYAHKKDKSYKGITELSIEENDFSIIKADECLKENSRIVEWEIPPVEKTFNYYQWISNKDDIKQFGFCNVTFNESISSKSYDDELELYNQNKSALEDLLKRTTIEKYLNEDDESMLRSLINKLLFAQIEKVKKEYCEYKAVCLKKFTINKMKNLYQIKKGKSSKPNNSGLFNLYQNCISLCRDAKKIKLNMELGEVKSYKYIGPIPDKGYIYVRKHITINPNLKGFNTSKTINIEEQKKIKGAIEDIINNAFSHESAQFVSAYKDLVEANKFVSLKSFLRIKTDVVKIDEKNPSKATDDNIYQPSNGEQSMLLLTNALYEDKSVYILDEPEMSVGHDYINNVIVPRIIELSKLNKTVVVSTHDANIAVRTLPFTTIYRCEGEEMKTYVGNPFNEEMINIKCSEDRISWAKTCIDTLEGGDIAFRERGDSYGKSRL